MGSIAALRSGDMAVLQQAFGLARTGDPAIAERLILGLDTSARQHPDVLFVLATALRRQGRLADARPLLESAVRTAPHNHQLWNSLGTLLDAMGDGEAAITALQEAVRRGPASGEAWINLALVATSAGRLDIAEAALDRVAAVAPDDSRQHRVRGFYEQAAGRPLAAVAAYGRALAANPADAATLQNLATAHRAASEPAAALPLLDRAIAQGVATPEVQTLRAHVLAELGQYDAAVSQYRAVIAAAPHHLDAQETLARLLPQLGQRDVAFDGYTRALAGDAPLPVWLSAIGMAKAFGDAARMGDWAVRAQALFGAHPDIALASIGALTLAGDRTTAIDEARAMLTRHPDHGGAHSHLAHLYLQAGDPAAAEPHALAVTALDPRNQAAWALLTLVWRLRGDPREAWLADYATLVMTAELAPPPGWSTLARLLADVAAALDQLHGTVAQPADQSLRHGTQTRGNLFERCEPVLQALADCVARAVAACLARLPSDATHPFLRYNTGHARFTGSWSVRLRREGFHISHIHPGGWLSSALYIAVPPEVGAAASGDAGKLLFGVPDATLGLNLAPRRIETPTPGKLVLFPSYFWHGTAPFDSAAARLTVAFDAVPSA